MNKLEQFAKLCNNYFAILVIIAAAIAYSFPPLFKPVAPAIPLLLGTVMLGMGLTLTKNDFSAVFERPKDVLIGVIMQFTVMPVIGYLLATTLGLSPALAAGFVLVGCVPGGTASNVMTYLGKGDVALSVTLTSVSTLLAPFVTPYLFLWLGGKFIPVNATALLLSIVKIVLLPVVLGVIIRHLFNAFVQKYVNIVPLVSIFSIITIVMVVVAASATRLASVAVTVFVGVILHNAAGYLLGYLCAKKFGNMNEQKSRAVSIEVGMQNSGLGAALAMTYLTPVAALPSAIFSVWHNISGPILATWWAKQSVSDTAEKIAVE